MGHREANDLEFKEDISNNFLKTVSAFANYGTGKIVFGINGEGKIKGLDNPKEACLRIEHKINDSIKPVPRYSLEIDNKNRLVILTVYEGTYTPYLYQKSAYRRSDSSTIEVDDLEYSRLAMSGRNLAFDMIAVKDTELSFDVLNREFKACLGVDQLDSNILRTLGLMTKDGSYTNGALLLADENDFQEVDIARFGASINEFLDRRSFDHMSLLSVYHRSYEVFDQYYCIEVIQGKSRERFEKIPSSAFREALANALVHRTWDVDADITIAMFDNRIEITSPGGIPKGLTKSDYLGGNVSILRNPLVANVFFRLNYIEKFGTGITRIREAYDTYDRSPSFEIRNGSIKVTLPVVDSPIAMTTDEAQIYRHFGKDRILSSSELAKISGFSKDKTIRILNSLESKHAISRMGGGRSTRYSLL